MRQQRSALPDGHLFAFSLSFCAVAPGFISSVGTQLKGARLFIPRYIIKMICQHWLDWPFCQYLGIYECINYHHHHLAGILYLLPQCPQLPPFTWFRSPMSPWIKQTENHPGCHLLIFDVSFRLFFPAEAHLSLNLLLQKSLTNYCRWNEFRWTSDRPATQTRHRWWLSMAPNSVCVRFCM